VNPDLEHPASSRFAVAAIGRRESPPRDPTIAGAILIAGGEVTLTQVNTMPQRAD
jgi:hypothetical protein